MQSRLYSAPEVAALLGVQVDTLYRYARSGKLPGVKIGKLWRFTERDIDKFVEGQRVLGPDNREPDRMLPDPGGAS